MVEQTSKAYTPEPEELQHITNFLQGGKDQQDGVYIDPEYKAIVNLKESEAQARLELISEIEYDFNLALNKGKHYLGQATINFYLEKLPTADELFLNSQALAIANLCINDQHITSADAFKGQKINLPADKVQLGWNTVSMKYFTPYQTNRTGLHTFTDQSDQEQYLYSQFEAFHCFRVFPCFDQPSLKAKMTLAVLCPSAWVAVSNSIDKRHVQGASSYFNRTVSKRGIEWMTDFYGVQNRDCVVYEFEQTPKISTYLYAVCAGPYKVFEDFDPMYVPQRIFIRQSLVDNLRDKLIFGITKTTLDLYQKTFGQRYPFTKVDHVMSPDYKYGAMENVGCITYSDEIMCAQKHMSIPQLTFFCVVIQHELAHMWFGNLVTMKWWNDLWLNEAFATSISYKACAIGGPFVDDFKDEAWLHMAGYKRWGLGDDLMPSNHNIQAQCNSTDEAESLIDGITYGKGSSMIKQLIFLMGWENFTDGLKIYFDKYKWSNTELPDFIGSLQQAHNEKDPKKEESLDLTKWAQDWLQTKGVNKIVYEYEEKDGKFTSFQLRQSFCKYADEIYRKQCINIGFYSEQGSKLDEHERVVIEASELTKLNDLLVGKQVPDAILLNSNDWGFGYFTLDDRSIKFFEQNLAKIENKLNKATVIGQLIVMMRQIAYPATRLPILLNQMADEKNQNLINTVFGALFNAQSVYLPPESVAKFNKEVATFFFKKAMNEKEDAKLQTFCIDKGLTFVTEADHLRMAASWIESGKITIEEEDLDCELTNEHKYDILKRYYACSAFSLDDKKALKAKTLANDQSDNAQKVSQICDNSLPDAALKEKLWNEITDFESKDSLIQTQIKIAAFFQRQQQLELIRPYFQKFYDIILDIVEKKDREFSEVFMNRLCPSFMATETDEAELKRILAATKPDRNFFILFLKKQLETIDTIKKSRHLCENFKTD